ncbi:30S ribosomal protein S6 [Patescibacteria group bacterium]|nr:30S ribosomal protein S6 [Patescibacteria group bacterium]
MYELLYLIPAPLTEKDLPNVSKKVKETIEKLGGKISKEENLGNKKLSYPIKQIYRGFYLLLNFEIDPKKLKELDQKLKLIPEILRHLVTKAIKKKKVVRLSQKKQEEKTLKSEKSTKKIDIKKLGEKIDDLFEI